MLELAVRVGVSLGVVLGLLWVTARVGSRRLGGGSRSLVRVRGRQALSRTSSLAVVEVGSRVLVLGVSDGGVRLLTELDPEEIEVPVADADAPEGSATSTTSSARPASRTLAPSGPLGGSLLSADTWKQALAAATARQRRKDQMHVPTELVTAGDADD